VNALDALLGDWRDGGGLAGLATVLGPEEAPLDDAAAPRAVSEPEALAAGERRFFGRKLPLSGRRDALERVYNVVRQVVAERRAKVVAIIGAAGLGKSRLLAETLAIIDPIDKGIDVLAIAADASDGPQALVGKLVRARFGIAPQTSDAQAYDRVLEVMMPLLGAGGDRSLVATARMLGFLAGLRAMGPGADALPADLDHFRRQALKTLVGIFKKDLERAPRILVVKRASALHPHAVEFLRDLVQDLVDTPFVVMVMAESPPEAVAPEGVEQVDVPVEPLSDRDVERLVTALLEDVEGLSAEVVKALVSSAHGSPRLVEENLHLLVQYGALVPESRQDADTPPRLALREWQACALAEDLETASRLRTSALTPAARALLQAAAVYGRTFHEDAVVAVAEALDRGWLERAGGNAELVLPFGGGELATLGLFTGLDQAGIIAADGPGAWRFRHGADQARLLAELLPPVRAQAHRVAAGWLRVHGDEHQHEIIAAHEIDGARPIEAAEELLLGAASAQAGLAVPRAKALYRKALHVLGLDEPSRGLDRAPLLLQALAGLAALAVRTGDYSQARALYWAALEAARVAGDAAIAADAWLGLGRAYRGLGEYMKARGALGLASDLFRRLNDSRGLGATLDQLARVHWLEGGDGGTEQALALFEAALAIRRRVGPPRALAETLGMIANIRIQHADLAGAEEILGEARTCWRDAGDLSGEARSLVALGALAFARGDRPEAIERWRDGLGRAEQAGERDLIGAFLNNIGEAQAELGDVPRAAAALVEAREIAKEIGDLRTLADVLKNLSVVAALGGDFTRADQFLEQTIGLADAIQSRPARVQALRAKASCRSLQAATLTDDPRRAAWAAEAAALYDEARAQFAELGDKWEVERTDAMRQTHDARNPG